MAETWERVAKEVSDRQLFARGRQAPNCSSPAACKSVVGLWRQISLPCSKANNGTDWSSATAGLVPKFRAWFLEKHQDSKSHKDAVNLMLGIGEDVPGAPRLEEFEDLLKQLQCGSSLRSA